MERQAEREGSRLSAEQRARCGTQSQDSEIMTWAEGSGLTHWATQAPPVFIFLLRLPFLRTATWFYYLLFSLGFLDKTWFHYFYLLQSVWQSRLLSTWSLSKMDYCFKIFWMCAVISHTNAMIKRGDALKVITRVVKFIGMILLLRVIICLIFSAPA